MKRIQIKNFAQIKDADITLGDLTLFIGPQASGKSLFLQIVKLIANSGIIVKTLKREGFNWNGDSKKFIELYFGENMSQAWTNETEISDDNKVISLSNLIHKRSASESVFYIPAQRVMTLEQGWPRNFKNFKIGDPFIVKHFSENLRLLMEAGLGGKTGPIFPQDNRLKKALRDILDISIFHGATIELDTTQLQRRIMLKVHDTRLPYMSWSAGQREFMPLLLGLYWLMPAGKSPTKKGVKWVIIEEPEMGLHPRAIISLMMILLDLIDRGYKLLISTHSPVLPECLWAIRHMQEKKADPDELFQLFHLNKSQTMKDIFNSIINKLVFKTFFFEYRNDGVYTHDISSLDPADENKFISEWGGLTEFSSNASDVISRLYQE